MSLTALLEKPSTSRKFDKVEHAYLNLPADKQDAFRQLIDDDRYAARDIAEALAGEGFPVDSAQVAHFRRKTRDRTKGWPELPAQ